MHTRSAQVIRFYHQPDLCFGAIQYGLRNDMLRMSVRMWHQGPILPDVPDDVDQVVGAQVQHFTLLLEYARIAIRLQHAKILKSDA